MDKDGSYSNLLLDEALGRSQLSAQDTRFVSTLFYGTLERRYTLDRILDQRLKSGRSKLTADTVNILRSGLYQIMYMDSVPDNAAVNESVKLAKRDKNPSISGLVNAVLRGFIRDGKPLPETSGHSDGLAVKYSCPVWLVEKWISEYGDAAAETMLASSLGQAPVTVRANTLRQPLESIIRLLREDGFTAEISPVVPDCLMIGGAGIESSRAYSQGLVHVQDISCQLCCAALGALPGETVLDICSAPGGKTFTVAEMMNNEGEVLAFDLHGNRARLIERGAQRLGLSIVKASANDGRKYSETMPLADRVLCDVPCSGLGVIRRKPEIKYKSPEEFERLPEIQYSILDTSSRYVKSGGTLVYSTCTLSRAENDGVSQRFLSEHPEFAKGKLPGQFGDGFDVTITPDRFGSDGFYIAVFRRER